MAKKNINEVVAANLKRLMGDKGLVQTELAKRSGVPQTTISLYLSPSRRKESATGKVPSGKLVDIEAMATALGSTVQELLEDKDAPPKPAGERRPIDFETLAMQQLEELGGEDAQAVVRAFLIKTARKRDQIEAERAEAVRKFTHPKV